jgi:hypothetical protein
MVAVDHDHASLSDRDLESTSGLRVDVHLRIFGSENRLRVLVVGFREEGLRRSIDLSPCRLRT